MCLSYCDQADLFIGFSFRVKGISRIRGWLYSNPKAPCSFRVDTWALKGLPYHGFGVSVYTIKLHGAFGKFMIQQPSFYSQKLWRRSLSSAANPERRPEACCQLDLCLSLSDPVKGASGGSFRRGDSISERV